MDLHGTPAALFSGMNGETDIQGQAEVLVQWEKEACSTTCSPSWGRDV